MVGGLKTLSVCAGMMIIYTVIVPVYAADTQTAARRIELQKLQELAVDFDKGSQALLQLQMKLRQLQLRYQAQQQTAVEKQNAQQHIPLESLAATLAQMQAERKRIQQTSEEGRVKLQAIEFRLQSLQSDRGRLEQEIDQRRRLLSGVEREIVSTVNEKSGLDNDMFLGRQQAEVLQQRYSRILQNARHDIAIFENEIVEQEKKCSELERKRREIIEYRDVLTEYIVPGQQAMLKNTKGEYGTGGEPGPAGDTLVTMRDMQMDLAFAQAYIQSGSSAEGALDILLQRQAALLSASGALAQDLRVEQRAMRELQKRASKVKNTKGNNIW